MALVVASVLLFVELPVDEFGRGDRREEFPRPLQVDVERQADRLEEAEASYRRSLELDPD